MAFVDLKSAFDSVDRNKLWTKLEHLGIDPYLLTLIQSLHSNNQIYVKVSKDGRLAGPILNNRGVRQGCILAPTLFNLFLSDLPLFLQNATTHTPYLNNSPLFLLLYADDAVIISLSVLGLKKLFKSFSNYCSLNNLKINYDKTKIMQFGKRGNPKGCIINGHLIQEVKHFNYLGITFKNNMNWNTHICAAIVKAKVTAHHIKSYFFSPVGNRFIPAVLQVIDMKLCAQLLYGTPVWISGDLKRLDKFHASLLRSLLGLANSVKYETICCELGILPLSVRAWLRTLKYWIFLHYRALSPNSLLYDLLSDSAIYNLSLICRRKLDSIGLTLIDFEISDPKDIWEIIRKTLTEKSVLAMLEAAKHSTCSPIHLNLPLCRDFQKGYMTNLKKHESCRLFMLARFNMFPSVVVRGRYLAIPESERLCKCRKQEPDTLEHIFFSCDFGSYARKQLFEALKVNRQIFTQPTVQDLLADSDDQITLIAAEFLSAVHEERMGHDKET